MPTTPAVTTPALLTDPGFLLWAPLGTPVPTDTPSGGIFAGTWDAAWVNLGCTQEGSEFKSAIEVEAISVAEILEPVRWATTGRSSSIAFALADYTAANLKRVFNGGTLTTTGTGATTKNVYTPPTPGLETRCMIGWESLDHTARWFGFQCINAAEVSISHKKVPEFASIPVEFRLETPTSGIPWEFDTAGTTR